MGVIFDLSSTFRTLSLNCIPIISGVNVTFFSPVTAGSEAVFGKMRIGSMPPPEPGASIMLVAESSPIVPVSEAATLEITFFAF